jgi:AAA15 family ATPase/GTPase
MYKQISIKNIKTFEDEQTLRIAPMTLIYGENSSGKTTLLKTFDIVHNIFAEEIVRKRGKNISERSGVFYRRTDTENISAKKNSFFFIKNK